MVLVCTQPVFVTILAYLAFGERTPSLSFLGILVALAGTVVIASDGSIGSAIFFGNTARGDRGHNGRRLRPYRPLFAHHGRGCFTVLDRRLRLGLGNPRPCGSIRGRAPVGVLRGDVVLALCGDARASDTGPHCSQLGLALRRSFDRLGNDPGRAGGLGCARVADPLREARASRPSSAARLSF